MALPPGFQGINFQGYQQWAPVNIDGFTYYQIPGQPQYVFDPYEGAHGTIKTNGTIVQQAIDAKKPKAPSAAQGIAASAGQILGVGLGSYAGATGYGLAHTGGAAAGAGTAGGAGGGATGGAAAGAPALATGLTPLGGGGTVAPTLAAPSIVSGNVVAAPSTALTPLGAGAPALAPDVAASAGAPVSTGLAGSSFIGAAAPIAGIAGGLLAEAKGLQEAKQGNKLQAGALGLMAGGTGIGVPLAIANMFLAAGGHGKDENHKVRSKIRDAWAQGGFADRTTKLGGTLDPGTVENATGTYVPLANGSLYDISGDKGSNDKHVVLDQQNPWSGMAVGWANPISILGEDLVDPKDKQPGRLTGNLANAIMSNAGQDVETMRQNALSMWNRLGMSPDQANAQFDQMVANKKIGADEAAAYKNGISNMISGDASQYTPGAMAAGLAKPVMPTTTTAAMPTLTVTGAPTTPLARPGLSQAVQTYPRKT